MSKPLPELILDSLNNGGERLAIEFQGRNYSWAWAQALYRRLELWLSDLGVGPGERVGLVARSRAAHIAALWALLAARRCTSMVYSFQSAEKLAADLRELRLPLVLADHQDWTPAVIAAAREAGSAGMMLTQDGLAPVPGLDSPGARARREAVPEVAIETLSSGTTGSPKRIALPWKMVEGSVRGAVMALEQMYGHGAQALAPVVMVLPLGNMSGIYAVVPPAVRGQPLAVLEKFEVEAWLELVRCHRPPAADVPPAALAMLLRRGVSPEDLASLRAIRSGASPLDREVQRELLERFGIPVLLSYGASEFCGIVTSWTAADLMSHAREKLGSCGRAVPGAELRIVDAQSGAVLPADAVGLLEARVERVGPQWVRTNDLCRLDPEGFLWFEGRADDAIMRGGFKIVPDAVDDVLRKHPAIADAAVVGLSDAVLGEVPVAALQLRQGVQPPSPEELEGFARRHLAAYQVPVRFLVVPEIPRTPSMKTSRVLVRQLFLANSSAS